MRARPDRQGMTVGDTEEKTPAGGEGGSRMGSGPLLPVSSALSLASAPPHPLQAKEPSAASSPGARWELNVVFDFCIVDCLCLTLKTYPVAARPLCAQRVLSSSASVLCRTHEVFVSTFVGAHPIARPKVGSHEPSPAKDFPHLPLPSSWGTVKVAGKCLLGPAGLGMR